VVGNKTNCKEIVTLSDTVIMVSNHDVKTGT